MKNMNFSRHAKKGISILLLSVLSALNSCDSGFDIKQEITNSNSMHEKPKNYADLDGRWEGTLWQQHFRNDIVMQIKGRTLTFKGTKQPTLKGTFIINNKHTPNHFDVEWANGDKVKAIIERTGTDTLRIENNLKGQPRPLTFGKHPMEFKRASK